MMIKEKIKIKKRTMPVVALLLIVVALVVGFNINKFQVHAYANESTDYETQYYELSPILEKNFYETGEQINVSFVLDSQYVLLNVTYETNGFTLATPLIVNENNISVVLDYISADNAEFVLSVETTCEKIFDSSIYGFLKDTGFVISQYPAQNIGDFTNINDANNQNDFNTLGLFDTVTISGKLSWTDESGNVHILRRTKYEYGGASVSDDGSTYIPLTVYYKYTDDFGNYSVSLNTLGFDVYITAYATGRSAGSTDASVTVYQDGGVVRQYENFVFLSNPSSQTLTRNHTITPSGPFNEDKEITRSFEICQAIIKGAEYVEEMRNGIDTPHVNVNYPSGLATNVGGGRAAYFSIPSPRIYIPVGEIDWNTLYHEYGHHIGRMLGIDDHPAQNLELHIGWPPLVFDLDYYHSMFNSTTYSSYSKSQHIRITWAEAYANYLSMMIRHYYLEDFNGIPASSKVRNFSIIGGVDEGEASVPAIQSVLWRTYKDILNAGRNINDIATGNSSTKIAIKNTHKVMWNILSNSQTNSTIKSYSAYSDYFTNNYPEHRSEFGRISAIHGMSPINVTFSTYSESVPPKISWQNSFVSTNYKVNNYSLVFYDNSNEEILRINDIYTTSKELSDADWTQVKNNFGNGDHVNIHVLAFQTNTPTTGGFISQAFKLSHLIYTPINNGGAYSITGILNKQFTGSIEILDEYQGNPVTQIGDSVFENCTSLTNITLPNALTSIGDFAFRGCTSLTSITIPNNVISIGSNAFENCTNLTNITLPNNLTSIGNSAFKGCSSLDSITIPNSVTTIGSSAFLNSNNASIYLLEKTTAPTSFDPNWNPSGNSVYLSGIRCTHPTTTLTSISSGQHGQVCDICRTTTNIVNHSFTHNPTWSSYRQHRSHCECGANKLMGHVVSGDWNGIGYATCLICGGPAERGFVQSRTLPIQGNTLFLMLMEQCFGNGSYILSNGVIVSFFNGTLLLPNSNEHFHQFESGG